MSLLFQSFGFKRGVPADVDLVFDVRMLPNPHWVKELRLKSGLDAEVQEFLESQPLTRKNSTPTSAITWIPGCRVIRDSNRSYMTVGLGCTGGQHRSVYLADRLYRYYREQYLSIHVRHRELQ